MKHNGYTWEDMPGNTSDDQRMNFSLYRREKLLLAPDDHGKLREVTCRIIRVKQARERRERLAAKNL